MVVKNYGLINLSCKGKYIVGVIYGRPNSNFNEFQLCFESVLEKLDQNSATYHILGDINIDLLKVKTNTNIEYYQNTGKSKTHIFLTCRTIT